MTKNQSILTKDLGIGDAAVAAKTGRTWSEWVGALNGAGCAKMNHKEIVAHLSKHYDLGRWWEQMVTVGYEQAAGLRDKHETARGYQVGASRTIAAPVDALYKYWIDAAARERWLGKRAIVIRKATRNKSIRITWTGGAASVEVMFYIKSPDRTQVAVQHNKLKDAAEASKMKKFWGNALDALRAAAELE